MEKVIEELVTTDKILTAIVRHLDVTGLKTFRRVCLQWKKNADEKWYKAACVRIGEHNGKRSLTKFVNLFVPSEDVDSESTPASPANYVFEKYLLEEWRCNRNMDDVYTKFIQFCTPHIKQLQVNIFRYCDNNDYTCDNTLMETVRALTQKVASLKVIQPTAKTHRPIRFLSRLYQDAPPNLLVTKLELHLYSGANTMFLLKFPNLKELKVTASRVIDVPWQLFSNLCLLRYSKKVNVLPLTHLDTIDTHQDFHGLDQTRLPLTYLALCVYDRQSLLFERGLSHYGAQLETLKLFKPHKSNYSTYSQFPFGIKFGKLKKLELWGDLTTNLDFLKETPFLTTLEMNFYCFEKRHLFYDPTSCYLKPHAEDLVEDSESLMMMKVDSFVMRNMQQLSIDRGLKASSWEILKKIMPNLKELKAPLDNKTLRVVCGQWPNLRKLKLAFDSQVNDEGLVGPSDEEKMEFNITHLEFLESLSMDLDCRNGELTDKSAELGFLQLKYLRNLRIYALDGNMSSSIEIKLNDHIENVELKMFQKQENGFVTRHGISWENWDYYNWTQHIKCFE